MKYMYVKSFLILAYYLNEFRLNTGWMDAFIMENLLHWLWYSEIVV